MSNYLISRIKQLIPGNARQFVIIVIWGVFSMWESYSYFNLQNQLRGQFQEESLQYFLLYHIGDLNNTFALAIVLYIIFALIIRNTLISFLFSFISVLSIFLYIEWSELRDVPFAIVGLLLFAIFVEQPKKRIRSS